MANEVNFQEEDSLVPKSVNVKAKQSFVSGISSFLISKGIVKTQQGAEYVLIGMVVVLFIAAIGIQLLSSAPHSKSASNINYYIDQMKAEGH
jgi:hypothetical protein